jgi:lysyl-tRNA synthetase class 2
MRVLAQDLIRAAARRIASQAPDSAVLPRLLSDGDWPVVSVHEAVSHSVGEPVTPSTDAAALSGLAAAHGVAVPPGASADQMVLELYDARVEPATTSPTFYTDFPASSSPLAEPCRHELRLAQKWDLVIGGHEIATAYTEATHLPSTADERADESRTLTPAWREVFAQELPPAGGLCIGVDRLVLALTGADNLHQVIAFPYSSAQL